MKMDHQHFMAILPYFINLLPHSLKGMPPLILSPQTFNTSSSMSADDLTSNFTEKIEAIQRDPAWSPITKYISTPVSTPTSSLFALYVVSWAILFLCSCKSLILPWTILEFKSSNTFVLQWLCFSFTNFWSPFLFHFTLFSFHNALFFLVEGMPLSLWSSQSY